MHAILECIAKKEALLVSVPVLLLGNFSDAAIHGQITVF